MCKILMIVMLNTSKQKEECIHHFVIIKVNREPKVCQIYELLLFCSRHVNLIDLHFFVAGCVHRQLIRVSRPIGKTGKRFWVILDPSFCVNVTMLPKFECMKMLLFHYFLGGNGDVQEYDQFE